MYSGSRNTRGLMVLAFIMRSKSWKACHEVLPGHASSFISKVLSTLGIVLSRTSLRVKQILVSHMQCVHTHQFWFVWHRILRHSRKFFREKYRLPLTSYVSSNVSIPVLRQTHYLRCSCKISVLANQSKCLWLGQGRWCRWLEQGRWCGWLAGVPEDRGSLSGTQGTAHNSL